MLVPSLRGCSIFYLWRPLEANHLNLKANRYLICLSIFHRLTSQHPWTGPTMHCCWWMRCQFKLHQTLHLIDNLARFVILSSDHSVLIQNTWRKQSEDQNCSLMDEMLIQPQYTELKLFLCKPKSTRQTIWRFKPFPCMITSFSILSDKKNWLMK
jgi:hypothetical protein